MPDAEREKILVVDDDINVRRALTGQLELLKYRCHTADDGSIAVKKITEDSYDLALLDIDMPNMGGIETLKKLREIDDEVQVIMVSGIRSIDTVRTTLRDGAYDYLTKPWDLEELKITVKRALDYRRLTKENKDYHRNLEIKVEERTKALAKALSEIKSTYQTTILALGSALETRDVETQAHALRVAHYSFVTAKSLEITDTGSLTNIEWGAYLHDIGKIGVPDAILRKPDSLSLVEWEVMKKHPAIGKRMIEGIPFLSGAVPIVYHHHESYDGTGYPEGLKAEEIPLEARIFTVADALDAMLSDRPYRKAMSFPKAKSIIESEVGKQFDPQVVDALINVPRVELFRKDDHFSPIIAQ